MTDFERLAAAARKLIVAESALAESKRVFVERLIKCSSNTEQKTLARRMDVTPSFMNDVLRGRRNVTSRMAFGLLKEM